MADNTPRRRNRNVTGDGQEVGRRGEGRGTGPVGNQGGYSGRPGTGKSGRGAGGEDGGTRGSGGSILSGLLGSLFSGGGGGGKSLKTIIIVIVLALVIFLVLRLFGCTGNGLFSSLFGGGGGGDDVPTGTALTSFTQSSTTSGWTRTANTGTLNKNVASGARDKYTTIKGGNKDVVTIMIYMCGTDLESQYGMATKDIAEIDKAGLTYDNYNVVLYTGGSMRWVSDIPSDCNAVLDMSKKGSERIVARTQGNANMGEAKTLTEFLNFCDKNYPAEHNALILWDHGAGPLLGYGSDEIYESDSLLLTEMVEAMQASPFSGNGSILDIVLGGQMPSGRKLDFVGFDACLMSCLESMEVWSKYADYYVASQELEPGPGWDYAFLKVLDEIAAETDGSASGQAAPGIQSSPADGQAAPGDQSSPDDGQTAPGDQNLSERITARIIDTYEQFYAQKSSATYNPDLTLNCVKLSRVKKVFSAYDKMARKMIRSVSGGEYASLMKRRADSKGFGLAQNSKGKITYYDLVDLGDLAAHMRELYPQEADAVTAALKEAVVDGYTNLEHTCGISLYFPLRNKGQYSAMKELYSRILKQAGVAQPVAEKKVFTNFIR